MRGRDRLSLAARSGAPRHREGARNLSDNGLDSGWFNAPLEGLSGIVKNEQQRTALFDLLDRVVPPEPVPGSSETNRWHPLLGTQPKGNVYLTVDTSTATTRIGVAGAFHGAAAGSASLHVNAPLVECNGDSISTVAGTVGAPISLSLSVPIGWITPAHAIALAAIEISIRVAPAGPSIAGATVTLRGLDLDGHGAHDTIFAPSQLGAEATRLLLALLREKLHGSAGPVSHLVGLLGLDGTVPPFPFATAAEDAGAVATWLRSMLAGASPPIGVWLGHLASLLGVASPMVSAAAGAQRWTVPLFAPNAASAVSLALTQSTAIDGVTPQMSVGVEVGLVPTGAPPVRINLAATIVSIPLTGTAAPSGFPSITAAVSAPANPSQPLIATSPTASVSMDSLRAGLSWSAGGMTPLIEMRNVVVEGIGSFPVVDLRNALTLAESTAVTLVAGQIKAALAATPTGLRLAALAGLVPPSADAAAPLVELTQLLTHPTRAIATLHRAALLSQTHPWKIYFDELALLLNATATAGSGTEADPWTATLVAAAPAELQLVAWNAQTSTAASDPQELRIALRIAMTSGPISGAVAIDLFGADFGVDGTTTLSFIGALAASVTMTPQAPIETAGAAIGASRLEARARVEFGKAPSVAAVIDGLTVTTSGGVVAVPTITYPFAGSFDVANPMSALGIGADVLERLVQALLLRALTSSLGPMGTGFALLLGCGGTDALAGDSPSAIDPTAPGQLFSDPLGALFKWLRRLAVGISSDGTDWITPIVVWLSGILASSPSDPFPAPDAYALAGVGTYDDPWLLPLGAGDSPAAFTLWLDPAGPPISASSMASGFADIDNPYTLAVAIAAAAPTIPALPDGVDVGVLGDSLQALADFFVATDGLVPVTSQIPTGGTWTAGTPIGAAHSAQPSDGSAIGQILASVDGWAPPGSSRAVLLLGPAFSDHAIWNALLAQAEANRTGSTNAAATFNLRLDGVAPTAIDLRSVTSVADFYTADLQDDGSNDIASLTTQIGLVVTQLQSIRPDVALILVAHSTAGLAARAYAAANAATVKGLITLGTPFAGAPLEPLTTPALADALRIGEHVLPGGVAAGPLADALSFLETALDGYQAAGAGLLPKRFGFHATAFDGDGTIDTAGVPALALGGALGGADGVDLLFTLSAALAAAVTAAPARTPTHLGYGARVAIPFGAHGDVTTEIALRWDLGRLELDSGAVPPPRPEHGLALSMSLVRPNGWLVGDPSAEERVRSAQIGVSLDSETGTLRGTPIVRLHEVSYRGLSSDLVTWGTPLLETALGGVFQAISTPAPDPASSLGGALTFLRALGLVTSEPGGFAADAIPALTADPLALLQPRLKSALASLTVPGLSAPTADAFELSMAPLPLALSIAFDPPSVGLRTVGADRILIARDVALGLSATMPLATMTSSVAGSLVLGPATLTYDAGALTLAIPRRSRRCSSIRRRRRRRARRSPRRCRG